MMRCERLSLLAQEGFCAGADLSAGKDTFNNDAPGKQSGLQRDGGGLLTLRLFESKNHSSRPVTALLLALAPQCNAPWTFA